MLPSQVSAPTAQRPAPTIGLVGEGASNTEPPYVVSNGTLAVDHTAEDIRHAVQAGALLAGDVTIQGGGLFFSGTFNGGVLSVPDGTLILGPEAVVEGTVIAKRVYNSGTMQAKKVEAAELLVNWGVIHAELVVTTRLHNGGTCAAAEITYESMESTGVVQGSVKRIESAKEA